MSISTAPWRLKTLRIAVKACSRTRILTPRRKRSPHQETRRDGRHHHGPFRTHSLGSAKAWCVAAWRTDSPIPLHRVQRGRAPGAHLVPTSFELHTKHESQSRADEILAACNVQKSRYTTLHGTYLYNDQTISLHRPLSALRWRPTAQTIVPLFRTASPYRTTHGSDNIPSRALYVPLRHLLG